MSIEKINRKRKGTGYKVWYRDQSGRGHAKVFDRKKDAEAFEAKITLMKRQGELDDLDAGRQKLADFVEEWWLRDASQNLEENTQRFYAAVLDKHVLPRLGAFELRQLRPELIESFVSELRAEGVGEETIRKTLVVLQSALGRAVVWGRLRANPVTSVKKPTRKRSRAVRPVHPDAIERMRSDLRERGRLRDATLISLLACAGLRPGEALALAWGDLGDKTVLVDKRVALGEIKDGAKSSRRARRSVRLLEPLAHDLLEWRLASGRPTDSQLVFPMSDERPWSDTAYRNWRKRVFGPTAQAAGIQDARPYDLRHSFCSLLLAEGRTAIDVAAQMGHSPTMTLETYGHIIEELEDTPHVSAEAVIGEDRRQAVNYLSTETRDRDDGRAEIAHEQREPTGRLELPTPSLRVMCSTN